MQKSKPQSKPSQGYMEEKQSGKNNRCCDKEWGEGRTIYAHGVIREVGTAVESKTWMQRTKTFTGKEGRLTTIIEHEPA